MTVESSAVCPECGSLRTRRISGNPLQRVLAVLRGQDVIVCHRCGWKGRQFRLSPKARRDSTADAGPGGKTLDYGALDQAMTEDRRASAPSQQKPS